MTAFWFSFAFTCGIFVGKILPKIVDWVFRKIEMKNMEKSEDTENVDKSNKVG